MIKINEESIENGMKNLKEIAFEMSIELAENNVLEFVIPKYMYYKYSIKVINVIYKSYFRNLTKKQKIKLLKHIDNLNYSEQIEFFNLNVSDIKEEIKKVSIDKSDYKKYEEYLNKEDKFLIKLNLILLNKLLELTEEDEILMTKIIDKTGNIKKLFDPYKALNIFDMIEIVNLLDLKKIKNLIKYTEKNKYNLLNPISVLKSFFIHKSYDFSDNEKKFFKEINKNYKMYIEKFKCENSFSEKLYKFKEFNDEINNIEISFFLKDCIDIYNEIFKNEEGYEKINYCNIYNYFY